MSKINTILLQRAMEQLGIDNLVHIKRMEEYLSFEFEKPDLGREVEDKVFISIPAGVYSKAELQDTLKGIILDLDSYNILDGIWVDNERGYFEFESSRPLNDEELKQEKLNLRAYEVCKDYSEEVIKVYNTLVDEENSKLRTPILSRLEE